MKNVDFLVAMNFLIFVLSLFGTLIFIYWWVMLKKATPVYIYVLLLIFAIGIENYSEFYFRYSYLEIIREQARSGSAACKIFQELQSPNWIFKEIFVFLSLSAFISHMSYRMYVTLYKIRKFKKEIDKYFDIEANFQLMIVEDNMQIPKLLYKYIKKSGEKISVTLKSSVEEALIFLSEHKIDMIICDMNLRGSKSGFDLVKIVKEKYPYVINIGMTGYPGKYTLNDARKLGFDDYFIKPFRLSDILVCMKYHKTKMMRWSQVVSRTGNS